MQHRRFTALFHAGARSIACSVPYRETRKIYEQFVMGYVSWKTCSRSGYPFSPRAEQALALNEIIDCSNLIMISEKQVEYLALQNQINPHFLYNTPGGNPKRGADCGL